MAFSAVKFGGDKIRYKNTGICQRLVRLQTGIYKSY